MHKPIQLRNVSLTLPHKVCFTTFNQQIHFGQRIAIIGRNGCGKSKLLKMILNPQMIHEGEIITPNDVITGYIPQIIEQYPMLSGGERFNQAFTQVLQTNPNVLLLDEPTNHLDKINRQSLITKLNHYSGTLIIATHDVELIQYCTDTLWHIANSTITVFNGQYHDYISHNQQQKAQLITQKQQLNKAKQAIHQSLMKEQQRHAKSKQKGKKSLQQKKWSPIIGNMQNQYAQKNGGKKQNRIHEKSRHLQQQLSQLYIPELLIPNFVLPAQVQHKQLLNIRDGTIAYKSKSPLLSQINLTIDSQDHLAIIGKNGSGKTSLLKAIYQDPTLIRTGQWLLPNQQDMGYLDQYYECLYENQTVFTNIKHIMPDWSDQLIREHLNSFLFRKNEEVYLPVSQLSGGEKARLALAKIALKPPKLLLLDEITNNIDLATTEHLAAILANYPAAFIIISHDEDFLAKIRLTQKIVL